MGEVVFNTAMTGYQEILTDPFVQGANHHDDVSPYWKLWDDTGGCRVAAGLG